MENASKALIIAGSILLSILIIALGMYIFSSSTGATDNDTLSNLEVSTFNGKFNKYKGKQNGTNVSALLDALISNTNGTTSNAELPLVIFHDESSDVGGTAGTRTKTDFKTMKSQLQSSHRYTVYMATSDDTDLIHGIIICYDDDDASDADAETLANT